MSTTPPGDKDVLGSLPRSRPGRSTARREAARAKRTAAPSSNGGRPETASTATATAKPRRTTKTAKPASAAIKTTGATVKPITSAKSSPGTSKRAARIPTPVAKAANSEGRATAIKAPRKVAATVKPKRKPASTAAVPERVPPAGWAVPAEGHGSADPAGTLITLADAGASILRGILRRLPG